MPDLTTLSLFLSAALILAITPGPGIFYVMTRTLKSGKEEGINSALGTAVGGMFHVIAAALGLSVILATSALAFNVVKYLGAAYLVYLGIKTILSHEALPANVDVRSMGSKDAFRQGVVVELLNPKTALFFLAFIPQFVNPDGVIFAQFLLLGSISVFLNTSADFIVIMLAGPIGRYLHENPRLQHGQRLATGTGLIALGGYVALTGNQHE